MRNKRKKKEDKAAMKLVEADEALLNRYQEAWKKQKEVLHTLDLFPAEEMMAVAKRNSRTQRGERCRRSLLALVGRLVVLAVALVVMVACMTRGRVAAAICVAAVAAAGLCAAVMEGRQLRLLLLMKPSHTTAVVEAAVARLRLLSIRRARRCRRLAALLPWRPAAPQQAVRRTAMAISLCAALFAVGSLLMPSYPSARLVTHHADPVVPLPAAAPAPAASPAASQADMPTARVAAHPQQTSRPAAVRQSVVGNKATAALCEETSLPDIHISYDELSCNSIASCDTTDIISTIDVFLFKCADKMIQS